MKKFVRRMHFLCYRQRLYLPDTSKKADAGRKTPSLYPYVKCHPYFCTVTEALFSPKPCSLRPVCRTPLPVSLLIEQMSCASPLFPFVMLPLRLSTSKTAIVQYPPSCSQVLGFGFSLVMAQALFHPLKPAGNRLFWLYREGLSTG